MGTYPTTCVIWGSFVDVRVCQSKPECLQVGITLGVTWEGGGGGGGYWQTLAGGPTFQVRRLCRLTSDETASVWLSEGLSPSWGVYLIPRGPNPDPLLIRPRGLALMNGDDGDLKRGDLRRKLDFRTEFL